MKHLLIRGGMVAIVTVMLNTVLCTGSARAVEINWPEPNWPEIFEPNQLLTLNIEMVDSNDWDTIRLNGMIWDDANGVYQHPNDPNVYEFEFPAWFWLDGEEHLKIKVAVRQKRCCPLGDANDRYFKISLKIDINEYYSEDPCAATIWHGLKKLSLENGMPDNALLEGLGCNLHRMASAPEGYGYDCWRASWIKLYVNGVYRGVYTNNEQIDKQFLRNRDIYVDHDSWLYKAWGSGNLELKVGDDTFPRSPAYNALCYLPFPCLEETSPIYIGDDLCSRPNDTILEQQLNYWVNMRGMLAMGVVNAFIANHDELFGANGHNFYCFDFNLLDPGEVRKRMYFPWDVDTGFKNLDYDIYHEGQGADTYVDVILGHPTFRSQYNQITRDLLNGPLSFADINDFIDMVEPVLTDAVAADSYIDTTAPKCFDNLRTWISQRIPNVLAQVELDEPTPLPGIILLDDGFEGTVWDANWTGNWVKDTVEYLRGFASAHADKNNYGDFTCVALDANDATAIHVGFWLRKNNITSYNPKLFYYNGTTDANDEIVGLDTLGGDDQWLHYTDTITDSNYFEPDFRIMFSATLSGGGAARDIWIDDVVITKRIPDLDGVNPVNFKDFAVLADDWRQTGFGLAGDITGDEVVDFEDLAQIAQHWLTNCPQ